MHRAQNASLTNWSYDRVVITQQHAPQENTIKDKEILMQNKMALKLKNIIHFSIYSRENS
jgi:hypothetical protein